MIWSHDYWMDRAEFDAVGVPAPMPVTVKIPAGQRGLPFMKFKRADERFRRKLYRQRARLRKAGRK